MLNSNSDDRRKLLRRGRRLEYFTIGWNGLEAVVAISAGLAAGSIALVGFGGDSVIETVAAIFVLRRLDAEIKKEGPTADRLETRALRVIAFTFWALAAYILYQSGIALAERQLPAESTIGLALALASVIIMPLLAWAKKQTGEALASRALVADAWETFVCAYLSFALLLGLGLHALVGWWWPDPAAALLMVPFLVREGRETFRAASSRSGKP